SRPRTRAPRHRPNGRPGSWGMGARLCRYDCPSGPTWRTRSGLEVAGDGAENRRDLLRVAAVRMLAAPVGVGHPVQQLDQVLDEDRHLVRALPAGLRHGRRRVKCPYLECLRAPAALGDAELDALPGTQYRSGTLQGSWVHKNLTPVVAGEEGEAFVGVIPRE